MAIIKKTINIYFDKECPFCKYYANYVKLKNKHNVHLLNAREHLDKIEFLREKGFDINNGIIVDVDGTLFQGSQALIVLNKLGTSKNILLDTKFFKYIIYPILTSTRKFWLFIIRKDTHI